MKYFDEIKSRKDIENLMLISNSDDGENLYFELKSSNQKNIFNKKDKENLGKEISAFANTYGGVLCYHNGNDEKLDSFTDEFIKNKFNAIESWLADSLEPRVSGIDLKIVENVFIIGIPESKTKPNRSQKDRDYYYRHNTTSQPMPEIMISSLYRSQEFLNFNTKLALTKSGPQNKSSTRGNSISFEIVVKNNSNIAGTNPKIKFTTYGCSGYSFDYLNRSGYSNTAYISVSELNLNNHILKTCGMYGTNSNFSKETLYPQEELTFIETTLPYVGINDVKYLIVMIDTMFINSLKQTKFMLFKFNSNNRASKIIIENENEEVFMTKIDNLIEKDAFFENAIRNQFI